MDGHGSRTIAERDERQSEAAILSVLLGGDGGGCIWSVEELVRELSAPDVDVVDGVTSLVGAGLVHRCGAFVFATRSARRFDRLDM